MSRKKSFFISVIISAILIFFLAKNPLYNKHSAIPERDVTFDEIQEIIHQQRKLIENNISAYRYVDENGKNDNLDKFVMERGGTPIRSIILSSWRSGSTFLGDVINAHPATYYHYEPLIDFGVTQIRDDTIAEKALQNIESLLNCNYSNMEHYLEYDKLQYKIAYYKSYLWNQCLINDSVCWNPRFLSSFCKLFPFQSMKLVRLRLRFLEKIIKQQSLRAKVIFLVRDPRGILQSRKRLKWCQKEPDCFQHKLLCSDLENDFKAAVKLSKIYPNDFRVVRYEDLSLNLYEQVKDLYQFLGLDFNQSVIHFLNTHTKNDAVDPYSTFRNSKTAPLHWRMDLNFSEVQEIQKACLVAMKFWGYVQAANASHQHNFNPITNYSLGN